MGLLSRLLAHRNSTARAPQEASASEGLTGPVAGFSRAELRERIHSCQWVHRIDLGDGTCTPGAWSVDSQVVIRRAFDDVDFQGKKVLDVGCWDGLWSFEAERRGAGEVYATDAISQRPLAEHPTLILVREYLQSGVKYFPRLGVHDVAELGVTDFDVVIFTGVYYHLKDPLLALARLRRVMREGATLILEGEVIDSPECFARFYYHEHYLGDASNWWVPTIPCLRQWVECSCFDIVREYPDPGRRRHALVARALRRRDRHYQFPDPELTGPLIG
jgi:tRNA (mo5U34)-methyltransferase